jgi:hypothetical protein
LKFAQGAISFSSCLRANTKTRCARPTRSSMSDHARL